MRRPDYHQSGQPEVVYDVFDAHGGELWLPGASRLPSFSYRTESIGEQRDFCEHGSEPLDQRDQPLV